ncbi:hypothetical protein FKM82_028168 [Ascaphus truei]
MGILGKWRRCTMIKEDEKNHPTVSVEPCVRHTKVNISITWIPRMDLHRLYVVASIWHESRKITKYKYDLCSGTDDEFEFCGVLKGGKQRRRPYI